MDGAVTHPFLRLLLATEHTGQDRGAETVAFAIAQRCGLPLRAVVPIASNPEYEALAPQLAAHAEAQAGERIAAFRADAARAGITVETLARRGPEAWREIVDEAAACEADLLVIRRRGQRGLLAKLLLGEMVRTVVTHAPCSVLVVPRDAAMWTQRVLVALDPEAQDVAPVAVAAAVAAQCRLPLSLLCVTAPSAEAMQLAERSLQRGWSAARRSCVHVDALVRVGRAHEQIVSAARETGADLIVIGRHGADAASSAWLGGVAQKVIGLADRPVLVAIAPATTTGNTP